MTNYITKRGRKYYYKRRIPEALQKQYQGKSHWHFTLGTNERTTALRIAREQAVAHDREISETEGNTLYRVHAAGYVGEMARKRAAGLSGGLIIPDMEDQILMNPEAKATIDAFQRAIKRWVEINSDDDINHILRRHVEKFKSTIMQLPTRPPHNIQKMPVFDQIEWSKKHPEKASLHPRTINNHLTAIRTTLEFAFLQTSILKNPETWRNPASGFSLNIDDKVEESKKAFEVEEIIKIFGSEYTQYANTDARYWIPLIAFYTGARLDEIAQTCLIEVSKDHDGWSIKMENLGDNLRTAKTDVSSQTIPLHWHLETLGFTKYVEGRRENHEDFLFDLDHDKGSKRGSKVATAFHRYFRAMGGSLNTQRMSMHSFRHSFRELAFECTPQFVKITQGHTLSGENLKRYGRRIYHRHDVMRRQVIDQIEWPQIIVAP